MEQKCRCLIFVLSLLSINCLFSQTDYIANDSTIISGVKLIEGSSVDNSQFIRLKKDNPASRYTPYDLTEYGFKNGTVYFSKNIFKSGMERRVFLERLVSGNLTLYYYPEKERKTFFLERDSTVFTEIDKDSFKHHLLELTSNREWMGDQIKLVRYKKKSLSKLVGSYNKGIERPLPFTRFGLLAGYNSTNLVVPSGILVEKLNGGTFDRNPSIVVGVFADIPIEMTDFSLYSGVNFTKNGFSMRSQTAQSDTDVVVNMSSIDIPLLLRYTWPTVRWRPFANIGGNFMYHLENSSAMYQSVIDQNVITIDEVITGPLISDSMMGYAVGLGLQHHLNYRRILSTEVRYSQHFGSENTFDLNQINILIGFSF